MIVIDKKRKKMISSLNKDFYVVIDFDRTLTSTNAKTCWGSIASSSTISKHYLETRDAYFDYYRPIEIDSKISFEEKKQKMEEWVYKQLELLISEHVTEDMLKEVIEEKKVISFREGAKDFLEYLSRRNIPVIILSAGIGNIIELFLRSNHCYYDNICIISNFITFENGVATSYPRNFIHSLNKNELSFPVELQKKIEPLSHVLLLGDQVEDTKMVEEQKRKQTFRVAYLLDPKNLSYFQEYYDLIVTEDVSYYEIMDILFPNWNSK